MKTDFKKNARVFKVGPHKEIEIRDWGKILLSPDEQVTFVTENSGEYDVVRKDWGFYATPSTNDRLVRHGFSAVLVKSTENKIYLFLVEKGREKQFRDYVAGEGHTLILWLDGRGDDLARLNTLISGGPGNRCICGGRDFTLVHTFHAPSPAEVRFSFAQGGKYERHLFQCTTCRHFISVHGLDDSGLYHGEYVASNYGEELKKNFDRINSLPPGKSDNVTRVEAVARYAKSWFSSHAGSTAPHILDVGSGLCVFLNRVKQELGWACTALDPDPRASEHAKSVVGIDVIQGDFAQTDVRNRFDIVSLNKVIEHVRDPVEMLRLARLAIKPSGFIYVEVPDGEKAILDPDGALREEFTIDHPHVFSAASLNIALARAGLSSYSMERLREPSGKYTIRTFAAL
jgi:SAM-dependent methyltransferase